MARRRKPESDVTSDETLSSPSDAAASTDAPARLPDVMPPLLLLAGPVEGGAGTEPFPADGAKPAPPPLLADVDPATSSANDVPGEPDESEAGADGDRAEAATGSGRDILLFVNRFTRWPKISVTRAAAVAIVAAVGVVAGAVVAAGIAGSRDAPDPVLALQESVRLLAVEVRSLKASVEASTAGGIASLGERLDRSDKAQAALAEEVGKLATALAASPVSSETTGSISPASAPGPSGWVLWRVRNGRALVHGNGTYYEVVPGSRIPGLGVVRRIAREDGRWVVTTDSGRILAPRS